LDIAKTISKSLTTLLDTFNYSWTFTGAGNFLGLFNLLKLIMRILGTFESTAPGAL
jgi:hypothetical protein